MGMYLVAPPIAFVVVAFAGAAVVGLASRLARRAEWLDAQADAKAAEEAAAQEGDAQA